MLLIYWNTQSKEIGENGSEKYDENNIVFDEVFDREDTLLLESEETTDYDDEEYIQETGETYSHG